MDAEFWHERWALNETGFHRTDDHPELVAHFSKFQAAENDTIFVPLCGKSRDLLFLERQGLRVIGVELSPQAIADFFSENGLQPEKTEEAGFELWTSGKVTIAQGDFFELQAEQLRGASLVYDRAALIALPLEMRRRYAARLCQLMSTGDRMLLITNSYDPQEMEGPPFSVTIREVEELYAADFEIRLLTNFESIDRHPGLQERGLRSFLTHSFLLTRV